MPTGYCVKERKKVEIQNPAAGDHEERSPGDSGHVPRLRHQDLQDRQALEPP